MTYQHKELAAGGWKRLSLIEQMANIGSEVERALNWKAKNNAAYTEKAFHRALELIDLTIESLKGFSRLKEVTRVREAIGEYFFGDNKFCVTDKSLRKYFSHFTFAARKQC